MQASESDLRSGPASSTHLASLSQGVLTCKMRIILMPAVFRELMGRLNGKMHAGPCLKRPFPGQQVLECLVASFILGAY